MQTRWMGTWLVGFVLSGLLSWGCAEDSPLEADVGPIPPGQRGRVVEDVFADIDFDTTFSEPVPTGDGPLLLVGKHKETETRFLLRFENLPDSVVVNQAELVLFARRAIGRGEDFEITVHPVTADWSEDEVTTETFNDAFDAATVLGRQTVAAVDSDTVVVALDTTLVTGWTDGSFPNNGVLVDFSDAGFVKTFLSRHTTGGNPELRLRFRRGDTTVDSTYNPTADAFLARRAAELPAKLLFVGNGIGDRAAIRFDLPDIPAAATVNRARLRLETVLDESVLTPDPIILAAFPLAAPLEPAQPVVFDSTFTAPQFFLSESDTVIRLDVTNLVQAWVNETIPAHGLTVRSLVTNRDITRVAFYSRQSEEALRPRIEVDYTLPPEAAQ